MRLESHQQVDLFLEQGRAMAEERSGAVWNDAQARIQEVRLERERIEDLGGSLLGELNHVRGNVEELESYLGHERVPETESAEYVQPSDAEPSWP
jgi:predicted nuclease with TOPRIM domain